MENSLETQLFRIESNPLVVSVNNIPITPPAGTIPTPKNRAGYIPTRNIRIRPDHHEPHEKLENINFNHLYPL